MDRQRTSTPRQKVVWFLYLLLMVACEVGGHRILTSTVFDGQWWGDICMDPPYVKPSCGWMILLTSDPPLSYVMVYDGLVALNDSGQAFYISNLTYNSARPDPTSEFCLGSYFRGSFGNTAPSYVQMSWYCICSSSTTTVTTATATISSTSISISACTAPLTSTMTTTLSTTSEKQKGDGFFTKHAGKCYISSREKSDLTCNLLCFFECLVNSACKGVNVEEQSYTGHCTFVTPNVFASSQLVNSDICDFWEKE